jgi:phosphatidylglycerophosphate synthase
MMNAPLDLHQAGEAPDWAAVPAAQRNIWQQLAADTQGVGTPGNALSIAGFCLVLAGLWLVATRSLWEGTTMVSIGRLADVADGVIAERTGTKSPLGRLLDAVLDKIGALLALTVFTLYGVLPLAVALAIAAQNIVNIAVSTYAPWRYTILNPSRAGKISTGGFWLAIITFVAARLLAAAPTAAQLWYSPVLTLAYLLAVGALILGAYASRGYLQTVRQAPRHRPTARRRRS